MWRKENAVRIFDETRDANPFALGQIAHQIARVVQQFYTVCMRGDRSCVLAKEPYTGDGEQQLRRTRLGPEYQALRQVVLGRAAPGPAGELAACFLY